MIRTCISLSILTSILALSSLSVVKAESASSGLPKALQECVNQSDDTLRLACYDREMAKLGQAPASAPLADPVETASEEEEFGVLGKDLKKEELTEITATVVQIAVSTRRTFTVRLDNDQIWRQKDSGAFQIQTGDVVSITKGNFGGYSLKRKGRQVSVYRVK